MIKFKVLFKDIFLYGITGGISKLVVFVLLPVLTSYFSADDYGIIEIAVSFTMLTAVISSLALESSLMRFWYDSKSLEEKKKLINSLFFLIFTFGCFLLILLYFFSKPFSSLLFDNSDYYGLITLGGISAVLISLQSLSLMVLRMERKIVKFNMIAIFQTSLYVTFTLILLYNFDFGIYSVMYGMVFSYLFSLTLSLFFVKKYIKITFNSSIALSNLKYSLPLVPAIAITWVNNQSDKYMLLFYLGLDQVGVFGASSKIAALSALVITIFRQAWAPLSMKAINDINSREDFYSKGLNIYIGSMFLFGFLLVTFSKEILNIIVPKEYQIGFVVIPWLIAAKILHGSAVFTNLGLLIEKNTKYNSIAALVGVIVNILIGVLLIPKIGLLGASIGAFVSEFIFTSILAFISFKLINLRFSIGKIGFIILLFIVFSLMSNYIFEEILIKILFFVLFLFSIIIVFRNDLKSILKFNTRSN